MKKKKCISIILALTIMMSLVYSVSVYADDIKVTLNGNEINFDQSPVIKDGRTLVPIRAIFEAMGCTVIWNDVSQQIDVATDFGIMVLGIGKNLIVYRNENEDRSIFTDVPPQIIGERTYVPVRAIAECTGYNVEWNDATQTVVITGSMEGITIPEEKNYKCYEGTKTPDAGECLGIKLAKTEDGSYIYDDVTAEQLVEYIETYLASAGYLISSEDELFGFFTFDLYNKKTKAQVIVTYIKSEKRMRVKTY